MHKLVFECFTSISIALSCFLSDFENMIEQLYQKLYDSFNNHEAYSWVSTVFVVVHHLLLDVNLRDL